MNAKTYIGRVVLSTLIVILIVLGLNYIVDPYAITGAMRFSGLNQYKSDINNYTRLSKKYQPLFRQHNMLIVGNSRVEMGMDPSHHCFSQDGWKVYNLGMPGAGVRTQLEYALNVMYQQPIKKILLSLDFTDFLSSSPQSAGGLPDMTTEASGGLEYLPSGKPNPDFLRIKLVDYYKSLFSLDAVVSSLKTVAMQRDFATDRDESGFNPARDFAQSVHVEGPRALFDQKIFELERKYSNKWYLRDTRGRLDQSFDDVSEFLAIAADRNVEVRLFTNPFHESYWDILEKQNLMPVYADWMQSMESLVRTHKGGSVTFWDFSQDSPFIHEIVPPEGLKSGPLNWFWEPSHYRRELGDLMIDAMFAESCNTDVVFGNKVI